MPVGNYLDSSRCSVAAAESSAELAKKKARARRGVSVAAGWTLRLGAGALLGGFKAEGGAASPCWCLSRRYVSTYGRCSGVDATVWSLERWVVGCVTYRYAAAVVQQDPQAQMLGVGPGRSAAGPARACAPSGAARRSVATRVARWSPMYVP